MNVGIAAARQRRDRAGRRPHRLRPRLRVAASLEVLEESGRRCGRWADAPGRPHRLRSGRRRGDLVAGRGGPGSLPLRRGGPGRRDRLPRHATARTRSTEVGGYDETDLQWAAEDQELNYRLRRDRAPDPPRPVDPLGLLPPPDARGAVAPVRELRHVQGVDAEEAPDAAVLAAAGAGRAGRRHRGRRRRGRCGHPPPGARRCAPFVGLRRRCRAWPPPAAGRRSGRGAPPGASPPSSICHWGYGVGFWRGIGRILTGRPFDTRPGGRPLMPLPERDRLQRVRGEGPAPGRPPGGSRPPSVRAARRLAVQAAARGRRAPWSPS